MSSIYGVEVASQFLTNLAMHLHIYDQFLFEKNWSVFAAHISSLEQLCGQTCENVSNYYELLNVFLVSLSWHISIYKLFAYEFAPKTELNIPCVCFPFELSPETNQYGIKCKWCDATFTSTDSARKHCRRKHATLMSNVKRGDPDQYCIRTIE